MSDMASSADFFSHVNIEDNIAVSFSSTECQSTCWVTQKMLAMKQATSATLVQRTMSLLLSDPWNVQTRQ